MKIRPAHPRDFARILALNAESVHFLSPLTPDRLAQLHRQSERHQVLEYGGEVVAFLLAFREQTSYDSLNYLWFAHRFERFLYVDRIVVSRHHRGTGAGRQLYEDIFAHAQVTQVPWVTCEFDIEPPNAVSQRFHARFGFAEVGQQRVAGGDKSVSLQAARVAIATPLAESPPASRPR